jgi:hypothetical protein
MNTELEVVNPAYTASQAIANLQQKEDPSARYYAAWWLGRFRVCEPAAVDALLVALEDKRNKFIYNWVDTKIGDFYIYIDSSYQDCTSIDKWMKARNKE